MQRPNIMVICISLTLLCSVFSCTKDPVDYSKDINDLKALVTELQHRSDSLATALGNTNTNLSNLSKSVDSIKLKLTGIQTQIDALTLSLTTANANIADINAQLILLNQQYASLLEQLNAILALLNASPSTLADGLVAYYPFSGNAGDSSGNANHGIVNGAILTTDRFGGINSAYDFNSNTINVPTNTSLGFTYNSAFSVSFWTLRIGSQTTMHFMGKRAGNSFNWQVALNMGSNQGICFIGNNGAATYGTESGLDCPINSWVYITAIFDNGNWKLFQNGSIISTSHSQLFFDDVSCDLTFGNSGGMEPFYGKLDDIRIYNRALSQSEITYLASH